MGRASEPLGAIQYIYCASPTPVRPVCSTMEAKTEEASSGRASGKALEAEPLELESGGDTKAYKRSTTRHEEEPTGVEAHPLSCSGSRPAASLPSAGSIPRHAAAARRPAALASSVAVGGGSGPAAPPPPLKHRFPTACHHAIAGSWLRGTWLLATSTAQPTLLGLPFGIAALVSTALAPRRYRYTQQCIRLPVAGTHAWLWPTCKASTCQHAWRQAAGIVTLCPAISPALQGWPGGMVVLVVSGLATGALYKTLVTSWVGSIGAWPGTCAPTGAVPTRVPCHGRRLLQHADQRPV